MTTADRLAAVREAVDALPWADAHAAEATGRLIVTLEADDSEGALERLQALKQLPGVISAELVLHCFEDEAVAAPAPDPQGTAALLNRDDEPPPRRSHYSRLKAYSNH